MKRKDKLVSSSSERLNILMASLTGPVSSPAFYERALRKEHDVLTFGPFRGRDFWESQGESFRLHAFYREGSAEHWADICTRLSKPCDIVTEKGLIDMGQLMKKFPGEFVPDLFIWVDQYSWNLPVNVGALNCPTIAVFGDTHMHINHDWETWLKYARQYDFVFVTFNKGHMKHFRNSGSPLVFWSPAALDPEAHFKIRAEKIYPVSFVGGTYEKIHADRVRLIERLRRENIDLYLDSKVLQDMSLVFSRSRIVLNTSLADDLNMRVFEVLGTGSLLMTNRLSEESGLGELFRDREHLVIYDDSDLPSLIRHYLDNPDERERIAAAGHAEALRRHTYLHRVRDMIDIVRQNIHAV